MSDWSQIWVVGAGEDNPPKRKTLKDFEKILDIII